MVDATQPVYNSVGDEQHGWAVSARYVPAEDIIIVYTQREKGQNRSTVSKATQFPVTDLEDVAAALQRAVRILGAPRLF